MSTPLAGIDISHWQARTPPLGATLAFVFVKATEGTSVDPKWAMHSKNVRDAGKVLGAYHFGRHGINPKAQASAFLNTIGPVRLVALDIEGDAQTCISHDEARVFIQAVQATGRKVGVYASESGFPHVGQDFNWVAKWGTEQPSIPWAFWQWGGTGIDKDRFHGTIEQLHELAGTPAHWAASVPAGTALRLFTVTAGVISAPPRIIRTDHPMVARPCTAPKKYAWPGHLSKMLVRLDHDGAYINAKYASPL